MVIFPERPGSVAPPLANFPQICLDVPGGRHYCRRLLIILHWLCKRIDKVSCKRICLRLCDRGKGDRRLHWGALGLMSSGALLQFTQNVWVPNVVLDWVCDRVVTPWGLWAWWQAWRPEGPLGLDLVENCWTVFCLLMNFIS